VRITWLDVPCKQKGNTVKLDREMHDGGMTQIRMAKRRRPILKRNSAIKKDAFGFVVCRIIVNGFMPRQPLHCLSRTLRRAMPAHHNYRIEWRKLKLPARRATGILHNGLSKSAWRRRGGGYNRNAAPCLASALSACSPQIHRIIGGTANQQERGLDTLILAQMFSHIVRVTYTFR